MVSRRLLAAILGVVVTASLAAASGGPAQAWEQVGFGKTGWAFTDSAQPNTSFINTAGDAPIGARAGSDGKKHKSRSYFTFDVSRFRGAIVHDATLTIAERSAATCASAQRVELWRTDPITPTTSWNSPPRPRELIGTVLAGAPATCPGFLVWDIRRMLQKLADDDRTVLTVMIRVPQRHEGDVSYGRMLRQFPFLNVTANHAPQVEQIGLRFPEWACGTKHQPNPVPALNNTLQMRATDQNQFDFVNGLFAVWPVGHEDQRVERFGGTFGGGFSRIEWDMSQYPHGTVLAWTVRAFDQHDFSKWAKPCYVKVDAQRPTAPIVTSADYPDDGQPHGGQGVPGTFVFKANGSSDVVGYLWGRFGDTFNFVPAPAPGADATVEITPSSFVEILNVRSVDSAGLRSERTDYEFFVNSTAPQVRVTIGGVGLPSRLEIATDVEGVTEFGYRIGDAAEVRVPASAGGTADTQIVFDRTGVIDLHVRSYVGTRLVGAVTEQLFVQDVPFIESADCAFPDHDGVVDRPCTFTFRPGRTGVVAYEYHLPFLSEPVQGRVDAGPDGTAVLVWTPTEPGFQSLFVRSVDADGTFSEAATHDFQIIDNKPAVHSSDYPPFFATGGVGIPGEFEFMIALPDLEAFVYSFNGGPEQVVIPEFSFARVTLTPDRSGPNTVAVRARFVDGSFSLTNNYVFLVSDAPVVVSTDYPENVPAGQPGQPGQFTFNPGRDGMTQYRYRLDSGEEQVVDAGPDGRATVEITPMHTGFVTLFVTGVATDGSTTDERRYSFVVRDPNVRVVSSYDEFSPRGGIGAVATFEFLTELREVTAFEYQLNGGPVQTVPRANDRLTTPVALVMERNGENVLSVRGRTANGQYTPQTDYPFLVGTAPQVVSTVYPPDTFGGGVGVPGDFTFTQGSPGVVEFEYQVDGFVEPSIVAAVDGVAAITFTPTSGGHHRMMVRGRTAGGQWTDSTNYFFVVSRG